MKISNILLILGIIFFTGCSEFHKSEQIKVKIVDIVPPKYFKIVVKDPETNETAKVSITKSCRVKEGLINSETTVTRKTFIDAETNKKSYSYSEFLPKETYCN